MDLEEIVYKIKNLYNEMFGNKEQVKEPKEVDYTSLKKKSPALFYYRVEPGETLSGIAERTKNNVDSLIKINKIKDPNDIYPDQYIELYKPFADDRVFPDDWFRPEPDPRKLVKKNNGK